MDDSLKSRFLNADPKKGQAKAMDEAGSTFNAAFQAMLAKTDEEAVADLTILAAATEAIRRNGLTGLIELVNGAAAPKAVAKKDGRGPTETGTPGDGTVVDIRGTRGVRPPRGARPPRGEKKAAG